MSSVDELPLTSDPVIVPLDVQSATSSGIDYSTANTVTITISGNYRVDVYILGSASSDSRIVLQLAINDVSSMSIALLANANTLSFILSNYFTLSAGDELTILMSGTGTLAPQPPTFVFPDTGSGAIITVQRVS
jgi:hypothetical protein